MKQPGVFINALEEHGINKRISIDLKGDIDKFIEEIDEKANIELSITTKEKNIQFIISADGKDVGGGSITLGNSNVVSNSESINIASSDIDTSTTYNGTALDPENSDLDRLKFKDLASAQKYDDNQVIEKTLQNENNISDIALEVD